MSERAGRRWLRPLALTIAATACAGAPRDPALREVLVHYESLGVDELASEGLRVDWRAVSGKLRLGHVVVRRPDTSVAARPQAEGEGERDPVQGTLSLLEGEPGRIPTGVDLPVATRTLMPYGAPQDTTSERESGFDVTAHVLRDGRVRLELVPFDERLGPREGGPVAPRSAPATAVTVAPGEKVAVGALARDSTSSATGAFSAIGRAPAREERVLIVWVELE
jgi:hypothetical protein